MASTSSALVKTIRLPQHSVSMPSFASLFMSGQSLIHTQGCSFGHKPTALLFTSRELHFTKRCLCLYLLLPLGALQWRTWNLYAYSSCWATGEEIVPGGLTGGTLTWTVRGVVQFPPGENQSFPKNGCMMNIYIYYCMFTSREQHFTKRCLCLYLLLPLGALQWITWNLHAYSSCWATGEEIVPGGLTGRTLTWTVRDVGLIPTWGKSIISQKWMCDEYLCLLLHVYI